MTEQQRIDTAIQELEDDQHRGLWAIPAIQNYWRERGKLEVARQLAIAAYLSEGVSTIQ